MAAHGTIGAETVARDFLAGLGRGTRDPFVLAHRCGFTLHRRHRHGAAVRKRHIFFDGTISVQEQRALVAECVARHLLEQRGARVDAAAISRVRELIAATGAPSLLVVGL